MRFFSIYWKQISDHLIYKIIIHHIKVGEMRSMGFFHVAHKFCCVCHSPKTAEPQLFFVYSWFCLLHLNSSSGRNFLKPQTDNFYNMYIWSISTCPFIQVYVSCANFSPTNITKRKGKRGNWIETIQLYWVLNYKSKGEGIGIPLAILISEFPLVSFLNFLPASGHLRSEGTIKLQFQCCAHSTDSGKVISLPVIQFRFHFFSSFFLHSVLS